MAADSGRGTIARFLDLVSLRCLSGKLLDQSPSRAVRSSGKRLDQSAGWTKYVKKIAGWQSNTKLHLAAKHGDIDAVRQIIAKIGAQMTGRGDEFDREVGRIRAAMVNKPNAAEVTALFIAAEEGFVDIVVELLKYSDKESLSRKNGQGFDALHIAAKRGHRDIVKLLLDHDPSLVETCAQSNVTPLITAATRGHLEVVNLLLERVSGLVELSKVDRKNALHFAACMGHVEIVKALLESDHQLGRRTDKKGQTALHMAVKGTSVAVVQALVNADPAIVMLPDRRGNLPLHVATSKKRSEIVNELLLLPDMNVNALNRDHKTAFDIAEGHPLSEESADIKNCLSRAGAVRANDLNQPRDELRKTVSEIKNDVYTQLEQARETNKRVHAIAKRLRKLQREGINNATNLPGRPVLVRSRSSNYPDRQLSSSPASSPTLATSVMLVTSGSSKRMDHSPCPSPKATPPMLVLSNSGNRMDQAGRHKYVKQIDLDQPRDELRKTVTEIKKNVHTQLEQARKTNKNVYGIAKELRRLHREGIDKTTLAFSDTRSQGYSQLQRDRAITARSELEHMLFDESAEPKPLPLLLLEHITSGFSDDKKIGSGGFATVYKGMLEYGPVAVKKLLETAAIDDKKFTEEVRCLMMLKHKNIVRFLGYCSDTQGEMLNFEGKLVLAGVQQRLLCFEYLPKGSLEKQITDASCGLRWRKRYKIINGICDGLYYLHQLQIVHLDLKPENILLDNNMMPKIADFGLSRCFDNKQSRVIASEVFGTMGYMAPEFLCGRQITLKSDIYSLGIILIRILTGEKGYPCPDIDNVLENWRNRLGKSEMDAQLLEIRVCTQIAIDCTDWNPEKRPDMQDIIARLGATKSVGYSAPEIGTSGS